MLIPSVKGRKNISYIKNPPRFVTLSIPQVIDLKQQKETFTI